MKYQTTVVSKGGREGEAKSEDGRLNVNLSVPKEMGGNGGDGTNPEQLFAAGYSACYIGALGFVAGKEKVQLPNDLTVAAAVGFGENPKGEGFAFSIDLTVNMPGMDQAQAENIAHKAHKICPFSNATRGNIEMSTTVNT